MKTLVGHELTKNNIKPTVPRMRIYEYLVQHKNHPSVDTVYRDLVQEMPTLSRTTVYNTLHLFLEKGLVQPVLINENEVRYDADTSVHGHFMCNGCGKVYDIMFDRPDIPAPGEGFITESTQIYYSGICPECRQ